MWILAIENQKGGVGKTTFALHAAFAAQERGLRVLLVDLDTQGNASLTLSGNELSLLERPGGAEQLFEADSVRPLETTSGIHLLHGHQQLDGLDHAYDLQAALDRRPFVRSLPYDVILFDTPPALGLRHLAPVVWADQIIAPIDADAYALSGLQKTIQRIEDLKAVNPTLTLRLIANRLLPRVRHQQEILAEVATMATLIRPYLYSRAAVSKALDQGLPVWKCSTATKELKDDWRAVAASMLTGVHN